MFFGPDDEALVDEFLRELERKDLNKTPALEKYGFGAILRSYYGLPGSTRLPMKSQHGVCLWEEIPPSELMSKQRVMLVFSTRWIKKWRQSRTGKIVIGLPNPFLLYKRKKRLSQAPDATGSVFFYAHSTANEIGITDKDELIRELQEIPADFGECLVAMHYVDMLRGEYKAFLTAGFKVFCAGHYSDPEFVSRFYDMLSRKKYALSNAVGSHYFYSVEHGLPFSYVGLSPIYSNNGYESDVWAAIKRAQTHISEVHQLEKGYIREVSEDQLRSVKSELGADLHLPHYKFWMVVLMALLIEASSILFARLKRSLRFAKFLILRRGGSDG